MHLIYIVYYLCSLFSIINGQYANSNVAAQYCSELNTKNDINIHQLTGIWIGNEIILHRDTLYVEKSSKACVYVNITEISHEVMSSRVLHENEHKVVTQLSPRVVSADVLKSHRHLLLEWTELHQKFEYNLQYNSSRRGFWMTWLRKQSTHSNREQPNFPIFIGTIQVLDSGTNHLLLTFCETGPHHQLYSIILTRQMVRLTDDIRRELRSILISNFLPTISERKVCNGTNLVSGSLAVLIVSFVAILSKWMENI